MMLKAWMAACGLAQSVKRLVAVAVVAVALTGGAVTEASAAARDDCTSTDPERSVRGCTKIIKSGREKGRNLAIAYNNRANAYHHKGDYARAIADYDKAIKLRPNYADAYYNRGTAYAQKGDYARAIVDYDEAIKLRPNYADAYNNRGNAYSDKGDHARAIVDYDKAIKLRPSDAKTYYNRGSAYSDKGDYARAIADYDKAIRLNSKLAEAYYRRGNAYFNKSDHAKALIDLRVAARLYPDGDPWRGKALQFIAEIEAKLAPDLPTPPPPKKTVTPGSLVIGGEGATISLDKSIDLTVISVVGRLEFGDEKRFVDAALRATGAKVMVKLDSPGGNLKAGIEIGEAIRLKGFRTFVMNGSTCASACALAWLGGRPRLMEKGALIGFHAAYNDDPSQSVTAPGNALVGAYLNKLALSESAILYMTNASPAGMQWLTFADAQQLGLEVQAFSCPECAALTP